MAEQGVDIQKAKDILEKGELVAIPTETVYGLSCNAFDEKAILSVFKAKKRPFFDPLIVHTNSFQKIQGMVEYIPEKAEILIKTFSPGPLTILFQKKKHIPDILTSGLETVGIRIPNHPLTLALLEKIDFPLAAPSANPFGYISPTTPKHVQEQLGKYISYILDGGNCSIGIESTIIGFPDGIPTLYRLGGTSIHKIEKITGKLHIKNYSNTDGVPTTAGMLKKHYSPHKKIIIGDINKLLTQYNYQEVSILSFKKKYSHPLLKENIVLSPSGSVDEAAKNIFASLRILDNSESKYILAELVPNRGIGKAVNDRLVRSQN
ncbi:MAG: L-threonylcarbamoyladenylate synthase [Chitinophagaceae bacterium]|nr:L-threonylcarbamoyladenylate synthase [Chitinophagaceae bacterium]